MRKSRMQRVAIACIAAFAVLGGIGTTNAQMHGGGGGFRGGGQFHGGGFHGRLHGGFFLDAPIIFGPGYYPYGYSYPYGDVPFAFYGSPGVADLEPQDAGSIYWYCRDPAGYYPDVQACPSGWLRVLPNN